MNSKCVNDIKNTFSWFLEYVLIVATILECNSVMLAVVCSESKLDMQTVFGKVIISTAVMLLALKLTDKNVVKIYLKGFFPILVVMEIYAIIYYFLGVMPSNDSFVKKDFIKKFLLMLPIYSSLLFIDRKEEKLGSNRLIYKYSNVVCIMAFFNLIVYYMSTFHVDELESEVVYLRWYNNGVLSSLVNCLNVCHVYLGTDAQSFNIHFLRDFGPFVEPLMFLIPLGTALFVELFLSRKDDNWCLWRCLLLSTTIFTVQSTYGLVMLVIAWGLKLISLCNKKERIIAMMPTIVGVSLGSGYFVAYKLKTLDINLIFERLMKSKHFTDFVYPLKAFLSKPLLAGGYLNNNLSISFFSEEALKDVGFSNSIAVVLGQGGLVLGVLCMLPFLIGLLQIFSKSNRKYALFIIGPLYLYTVTIFHYRYFLIFVFALGYSLLEIEREKGKGKYFRLRMIQIEDMYDYGDRGNTFHENIKVQIYGSAWKEAILITILAILTVSYGTGLWNLCYKALYQYQLTSGQSGIRVLYGIISLIALLTWCKVINQNAEMMKQKFVGLIYVIVIQIMYVWAYSTIYSYADTIIQLCMNGRELVRETMVLFCYVVSLGVAHILYTGVRKAVFQKNVKIMIIPVGVVAIIWFFLALCNIAFTNKMKSMVSFIETQIVPLRKVIQVKSGKLYSDELPVLYNYVLNDVTYGVVRGEGYRVLENLTVIEPKEKKLQILFDEGFCATQISDNYIIYSNDKNVIDELSKEGYKFYRYYAFERDYDLEEVARLSGLTVLKDEGEEVLLVEGEEKSLIYGPYDIFQPGIYTVTFSLKINQDEYSEVHEDTVIASIRTSHNYGKNIDQLVEIKKSDFDKRGYTEVESVFIVNSVMEGYEYLVFGKDDYDLEIHKIDVHQNKPDIIKLIKYNVHQKPIYEEYYDSDGNLSYSAQGNAALEKHYNSSDKLVETRYLDENGNLKCTINGYAKVHYEYDNKMQLIKETYYDERNKITTLPEGYAIINYAYDDRGREVEYRYCDANNQLKDQLNGIAMIRYRYNEDDQIIRCDYYDYNEKKRILSLGYCTEEYEYNDTGQRSTVRYLGLDSMPVERTDNLASEIHYFYDDKKRDIRQEFYGVDGKRKLTNLGYSAIDYEKNDNGNVVLEEYYGINDERVISTSGYWKVKRIYNNMSQLLTEEYFGTDGEPILILEKYAMVDFTYNNEGKLIKKSLRDKSGQVVEEQSLE